MPSYQSHLLVHIDSFAWKDLTADRTSDIEHYSIAVVNARKNKDEVYLHPDLWYLTLPWGSFSDLVSGVIDTPSWLTPGSIAFRFLCDNLLFSVIQISPSPARNLEDLKADFDGENCGLIGCHIEVPPAKEWVYDERSWREFHLLYIAINPHFIDWSANTVLPNLAYSNQYLCGLVGRQVPDSEIGNVFREEVSRTFPRGQGGEGQMIPIAREIARRNFYIEDYELSSREQRRTGKQRCIFKVIKNNEWQYLSLDFEKCTFEVCNHRGEHQGEWCFDGKENGVQTKDFTGKHDILSLR